MSPSGSSIARCRCRPSSPDRRAQQLADRRAGAGADVAFGDRVRRCRARRSVSAIGAWAGSRPSPTGSRTGWPPARSGTTPPTSGSRCVSRRDISSRRRRRQAERAAAGSTIACTCRPDWRDRADRSRACPARCRERQRRRRRLAPRGSPCIPVGRASRVWWPTLMPVTAVNRVVAGTDRVHGALR